MPSVWPAAPRSTLNVPSKKRSPTGCEISRRTKRNKGAGRKKRGNSSGSCSNPMRLHVQELRLDLSSGKRRMKSMAANNEKASTKRLATPQWGMRMTSFSWRSTAAMAKLQGISLLLLLYQTMSLLFSNCIAKSTYHSTDLVASELEM